jgi:protein-tyrosine phosphatase
METTEAAVHWDGAFNLRDLGGLPLLAGGTTAQRRVFRSGAPEYLTTRGWRDAVADGLRTVVDLRNAPAETKREAHHAQIDEEALAAIDILNRPTEDPLDPEFMRVCGPWLDHPRSYADNVAFYPQRFAALFEAMASGSARGAVLVQCAGGRDRTGMVVAMLLSLVGVETTAIVDDYSAAFRAVNGFIAEHPEASRERARPIEELDARVAERAVALEEWLRSFDAESYLMDAGLSLATIARLRGLLAGRAVGH